MADDVENISRAGGASYDGSHASGSGKAGGNDFRRHAASTQRRTGGGDVGFKGGYIFHHLDRLSVSGDARILIVEAVHIRHEEQIICLDHPGGDGREGIIVAKFDFLTSLSNPAIASATSSTYRNR